MNQISGYQHQYAIQNSRRQSFNHNIIKTILFIYFQFAQNYRDSFKFYSTNVDLDWEIWFIDNTQGIEDNTTEYQ